MSGKTYRPCVVAVLEDDTGRLLVGQRSDSKGWQLPQGGIDSDESPEQALRREVMEEVGIDQFHVIAQLEHPLRYTFPKDATFALSKKFLGQEQYWFHCRLLDGHPPNLEMATDDEFCGLDWLTPAQVVEKIIDWKKDVYTKALEQLGLLAAPGG